MKKRIIQTKKLQKKYKAGMFSRFFRKPTNKTKSQANTPSSASMFSIFSRKKTQKLYQFNKKMFNAITMLPYNIMSQHKMKKNKLKKR